ncbi:hypothetical protein ACFXTH_015547 [Malus domestica]
MVDALKLFDLIADRNVFSWNIMISGYNHISLFEKAWEMFCPMHASGFGPDEFAFGSVLSACIALQAPIFGKQVYSLAMENGFFSNGYVQSGMIDLFAKNCSFEDALRVFHDVSCHNVVVWNAIISGPVRKGENRVALHLFWKMCRGFLLPNSFTFSSVLTACAALEEIEVGKEVQGLVIKRGAKDVFVGTTIVDLYAKCGEMNEAVKEFSPSVVGSALINTYSKIGAVDLSEMVFREMENIQDLGTWAAIISSIAQNQNSGRAIEFFWRMLQESMRPDSSLFTMYSKCDGLEESYKVFQKIPDKGNVSWASMIAGFVERGCADQALQLYREIPLEEIVPDQITLTAILTACSALCSLRTGMEIHCHALRRGVEQDVLGGAIVTIYSKCSALELARRVFDMLKMGSSLVTMYSKCGSTEHCLKAFDQIEKPDLVCWTAMIVSYAQHGKGAEALRAYELLREQGIRPISVTFVALLSACSHNGLVEEAYFYFNSMVKDFGLKPGDRHYACLIDLLSRSGRLKEAATFIDNMPIKPNVLIWGTLQAACIVHGDTELGKLVAKKMIMELEPSMDPGAYISISNMYADVGHQCFNMGNTASCLYCSCCA